MPRPAVYGLTALAFLAGFVLAGTLAFTYRSADAVAEPTLEPTPAPLGPCSTEMEHAYEMVRFAQYTHIPWRDRALRGDIREDELLGDYSDPRFQQWWIDEYATVLETIEAVCVPDPAYPNLTDLPSGWGEYPPR